MRVLTALSVMLVTAATAASAATVGDPLRAYTQSVGDPVPLSDPEAYMPERPFYRAAHEGPVYGALSYRSDGGSFETPFRFTDRPLIVGIVPLRGFGLILDGRRR